MTTEASSAHRASQVARYDTCLYCEEPTGSLEHLLASGIGGRLTSTTLVCGEHNNQCGRWADAPLSQQFEFAIHCLEALKGDGSRGTTWHGLVARDGQRFDMLPDFRARMKQRIERTEEDGLRVFTTHDEGLGKIDRQLSAKYDLAESFTITRSDVFRPVCSTRGPGMRGILKAALHFVATQTADAEQARAAARSIADDLFSEAIPTQIVRVQPYDLTRRRGEPHSHELTAWNDGTTTFVLVSIFNIARYLVILPFVALAPTRYRQDTRTGRWKVEQCEVPDPPTIDADPERAKQDFAQEYALRIDLIVAVGQSKSDIADIILDAKREQPDFERLSRDEKIAFLESRVRERFTYPLDEIPIWLIGDVQEFTARRILESV